MISIEVQAAVITLQRRVFTASDIYELERIDRTLDELLRSPERTTPAPFQTRSAMAHAGQVLADRRRLGPMISMDASTIVESPERVIELPVTDGEIEVLDILVWLETTPSLTETERTILRHLAAGEDAATLAPTYDIPAARMRERISRARAAGRAAYQREVGQ